MDIAVVSLILMIVDQFNIENIGPLKTEHSAEPF